MTGTIHIAKRPLGADRVFLCRAALAVAVLFIVRPAAANSNQNHMNFAVIGSVAAYAAAFVFGERTTQKMFSPQVEQRGIGLQLGRERDHFDGLDLYQVTYNWYWRDALIQRDSWRLKGAWQVNASLWKADGGYADDRIYHAGITPFLRLEPNTAVGGVTPYLEFGIGPQLLSETGIAQRLKSTRFQFGSNYGLGVTFGAKNAFRLGYRFLHVSNADIKKPNQAVDFYNLFLEYRY